MTNVIFWLSLAKTSWHRLPGTLDITEKLETAVTHNDGDVGIIWADGGLKNRHFRLDRDTSETKHLCLLPRPED